MRDWLAFYLGTMKIAALQQFQYRAANYFYIIGMFVEPLIYMVVWSTVARAQGGAVGGYTPGAFAAYYIVWTLVRSMNIVFTPYGWEGRIRQGELSAMLLRPLHPLHYDIAYFAGWKLPWIIYWLPLALVLSLIFQPTLHLTPLSVLAFSLAIWGAYLIRTMLLWLLGLLSFWTTRVSAIFELYFALELLLAGRLVPLSLMPPWVQTLASFLPFQWTFAFPIETLIRPFTPAELGLGLATQAFWIAAGAALIGLVWRRAVRRYGAVGG